MARPSLTGTPMSAAERQRRHRAKQAAIRNSEPEIPIRVIVELVLAFADGRWRSARWIVLNVSAPPEITLTTLADMVADPERYGVRTERRQRGEGEEYRILAPRASPRGRTRATEFRHVTKSAAM